MEAHMDGRRIRRNLDATGVLCAVLLFVFSALAAGCRHGETGTDAPELLPFTLSLPAGAKYAYDTWTLDQRSYPTTKTTTSWRVLSTQETFEGKTGVTMIADSTNARKDTLYLASTPAGDLYIHGFLARITRRRFGYQVTPQWDLVASFSAGKFGSWKVGAADSLGLDVVYGNVSGTTDYYTTTVDGVTEVFPTRRVDLAGETIYYSIWFSNSPNAIVRFLEEPDLRANGQLKELVAIKTGGG
jgi:hypothetical protein